METGVQPTPARVKPRTRYHIQKDEADVFGIAESDWEPLADYELPVGKIRKWLSGLRQDRRCLSFGKDLHPLPSTRLSFHMPHTATEMTDAWFELLFSTIRNLLWGFCQSHFQAVLLPGLVSGAQQSIWEAPLAPAFIQYAARIARQDELKGGWDSLLADEKQRSYLVMGIVAKALEDYAFSALFFGGNREQKRVMDTFDRAMLSEEGYARKIKRAKDVRIFLGTAILPSDFWKDVSLLTSQLVLVLLPLVNLQRAYGAPKPNSEAAKEGCQRPPGLTVLYQDLQNIVALAGYASVCMARSSSVFLFAFTGLGQAWPYDQEHFDAAAYCESVEKAFAADSKKHEQQQQQTKTSLSWNGSAHGKRNDHASTAASGSAQRQPQPPEERTAKVQITVWPLIRRYRPEYRNPAGQHRRTLDIAAISNACKAFKSPPIRETVVVLSKSYNVYYAGSVDDEAEGSEAASSLITHVNLLCKRRRRAARLFRLKALILAVIVLVLAVRAPLFGTKDALPFGSVCEHFMLPIPEIGATAAMAMHAIKATTTKESLLQATRVHWSSLMEYLGIWRKHMGFQ